MANNTMRVISKIDVQAPIESIDAHNKHVDLTPWDLQLLLVGPIQEGFIFHKPQNSSSMSALIRRLAASLSQTLLSFPPLAGRLSMTQNDDATASFSIDCNNAGALFVHATAADSLSVSDVLDAVYVPPAVSSFFPLNGAANVDGVTQPLLAVQVTELAGDGLFVACTVNHVAADGTSFLHFLKSWSEISRGLGAISKPPSLRRWFPVDIKCPIRIPLVQLRKKHYVKLIHDDDMPEPPLLERVYRFSEEKIKELKAKANSEMGSDRISSLQALLAYFWRSVVRSQRLERDEDVYFVLAIGARSRVHQPPLPEEYLGNAVHVGRMKMKAGDLLDHGIGHVAWEMNKMVGMHTQDMIKSSLKSWSENPTLIPMSTKYTRINVVAATNSPRFKVYDTDFGWGRPIAVRNGAGNKAPGKVVLYPGGPEEDDGIEIHACFFPQVFHSMEKDSEFMNKVNN